MRFPRGNSQKFLIILPFFFQDSFFAAQFRGFIYRFLAGRGCSAVFVTHVNIHFILSGIRRFWFIDHSLFTSTLALLLIPCLFTYETVVFNKVRLAPSNAKIHKTDSRVSVRKARRTYDE